ncbi:MAG: iron-sulfur cluster co-chaperone HscB C-terminal domain-containing protein [Phycisphaerales bacterium]|nr:iron-sulfur cluster co-chaperone HscB C-terminal domain-containing protein [Phycisphaerales bacterium]
MTTQSDNPFLTLNLPLRYRLDPSEIEKAYLGILANDHPDAGGVGMDSASVNAARSTLLNAEKRANTLLELRNGPSASQLKELPDGFLIEMMSLRQEIEEELNEKDEASREKWEKWASDQRADYSDQIAMLFDSLDDDPSASALSQIRIKLNAWRYIERLIEQLDPDYDPASADFR